MGRLTSSQATFRDSLARRTGLNRGVIEAWMLAEESGGAAQSRQAQGNNNWLNIGYFDSGPGAITKDRAFRSPQSAARATSQFLKGKRFGASSGIQNILSTVGKGPTRQIQAIAGSGWASSGYGGGGTLRSLYEERPPLSGRRSGSTTTTTTTTTPGVDRSAERQALLLGYLDQRNNPDALLSLASGLQANQDTPGSSQTVRNTQGGGTDVQRIKAEAQHINDAHVPYQWGGGHGGKQGPGSTVTPLDCSGAVSRALGINPRVSGQFMNWGKPGRGKGITIYANAHHVLLEINGHFWGTSRSNPGGGAGWIPRGVISKSYLSQFTARHPAGG